MDPAESSTYNNLGAVLVELERYVEAEAAFREALRLDPNDPAAYHNLNEVMD